MERGQEARDASNINKKKGVGRETLRHTDQYGQSYIDIQKTKMVKRGKGAIYASNRNKNKGIGREIFKYTN